MGGARLARTVGERRVESVSNRLALVHPLLWEAKMILKWSDGLFRLLRIRAFAWESSLDSGIVPENRSLDNTLYHTIKTSYNTFFPSGFDKPSGTTINAKIIGSGLYTFSSRFSLKTSSII